MQPRGAAFALAALLAAGGLAAAQAPSGSADGSAGTDPLAPIRVALGALPGAVSLAIDEAERRLISDQAQDRLDRAHAYVQGFTDLPPGDGALEDPQVRAAYAWTQDTVETFLAVPAQLDAIETAGATCRFEQGLTAQQATQPIASGTGAHAALQAVLGEARALLAAAPPRVDATPLRQALATLEGWQLDEGAAVQACLQQLAATHEVPPVALQALLVPPTTHPTGRFRVLGALANADDGAIVRVQAASLGIDDAPPVRNGTGSFQRVYDVPRATRLGAHPVTVSAGDLRVDLTLEVAKAPVTLDVQVPGRVAADRPFPLRVTATSPAGAAEVDLAKAAVSWRGSATSLTLAGGSGAATLAAGNASDAPLVLVVRYPGTDILQAAEATREVRVLTQVALVTREAAATGPAAGAQDRDRGVLLGLDLFWWILLLVLAVGFAALLLMSPVWVHRWRGVRSEVLQGPPPPPRWPGATTFVAAMAALFGLLRRLGLVPPGRTVREWLDQTGAPAGLAQRFDAVRYGGDPEDEPLRTKGIAWVEAAWQRWRR